MRKNQYIKVCVCSLILASISFTGCEFDEPFPDPSGDFTIWGINRETNAYEQVTEPYNLYRGTSYDFKVEGTGQQFVFWWGEVGDPESNSPRGSDFNDRGQNHYSRGTVAIDMKASKTYTVEGEYEVVLVASSYSYSADEYKESITKKTITVVAP